VAPRRERANTGTGEEKKMRQRQRKAVSLQAAPLARIFVTSSPSSLFSNLDIHANQKQNMKT
jgi:hypothetical protein